MTWRSRLRLGLGLGLAVGLAASCGQHDQARDLVGPARTSAKAAPARLVVLVVLDQVASWTLLEHEGMLSRHGAVRRLEAEGRFIPRSTYPYAATYTAPGHATIATGRLPREHGVVANKLWDPRRGELAAVDDGVSEVLGHAGAFASPRVLAVETVADELRRATGGRAHIVSVSLKDRAAVLLGGQRPDAALWFDAAIPGFTTSRYYADALPAWLSRWQAAHPASQLLEPWMPHHPADLAKRCTDPQPGEADLGGFGTVFPHDPRRALHPYDAARTTPAANRAVLALARAAVTEYHLGEGATPDLLAISLSATDYAAHAFGPDSCEYLDVLWRADRDLGRLLDDLEREHGPIAVVLTSDHGAARLPELAGGAAARIDTVAFAAQLDQALAATLGPGPWIAAYVPPYVSFTAKAADRRVAVAAAALTWLAQRPEIALAIDARAAAPGSAASPLRELIEASRFPGRGGDLYLAPAEGVVALEDEPRSAGTSHGSPWAYDREVPLLVRGPGVPIERDDRLHDQREVAVILRGLLGLAPAR